MAYTIELDCPPGTPRPGDLLPGVLAETEVSLDPDETVSRLFGNWMWEIPAAQEAAFLKSRNVIKSRIKELHTAGLIRYGSW
jgi:hypothetical protein